MKRLAVGLAVVMLATGCASDMRGTGDAPVKDFADKGWDIQNAPDGYGNIATRCSSYVPHTRLWIVTHGHTDVQPVITTDEQCTTESD